MADVSLIFRRFDHAFRRRLIFAAFSRHAFHSALMNRYYADTLLMPYDFLIFSPPPIRFLILFSP